MGLNDFVPLTITVNSTGITRAGYGTPGVVSHNAPTGGWTGAERSRTYTDISGAAADWGSDSPEYLALAAIFSQSPRPTKAKVLRATVQPTMSYSLSVVNVRDSHTYQLQVEGEGVTSTPVEYASDATATDAEIATGLVAALNLVTGKNFTAAGASSPFTVTGDNPGDWFSLEVLDRTDLSAAMDHADPGMSAELDAINLADSDWYELHTLYNSSAYVLAVAAWVEANGTKRYRAGTADTKALTDAVGGDADTLDKLKTLAYERTMGCYYPSPATFFECAWGGRVLPADPGTIIEAFKSLSGVAAVKMTATERTNLTAKNGNSYETAGVDVTFDGKSASYGQNQKVWYFDSVRDRDALGDDIQKSVMEAIAGADKVEYSDAGVAVVEGALRGSLRRNTSTATQNRILSATPAPTVSVPKVADVSAADKSARLLPDVKASGTLGGGIQKVPLAITVSI